MDRIDPLFFVNCSRISIKEETRIKATTDEASTWEDEHRDPMGIICLFTAVRLLINELAPAPNFISNIFFLAIAMSHFGYIKTISTYNDLGRVLEDIERHLEWLQGDGSWMGVSLTMYLLRPFIQVSARALYNHGRKRPLDKSRRVFLLNLMHGWELIKESSLSKIKSVPDSSHTKPGW